MKLSHSRVSHIPDEDSSSFQRGQIESIQIPAGWQRGETQEAVAASSFFTEFHPPDQPDVRLVFYYRGRRLSHAEAEPFKKIVEQAPHALSADELDTIRAVLRKESDPNEFRLTRAETVNLNGKRVLVTEGRFLKTQKDRKSIFIDADRTGSAIQEVYIQAPTGVYAQYEAQARAAFDSIEWK